MSPPGEAPLRVVYLCTGNAARSVMATVMTRAWVGDAVEVRGAGTFSIPGLPMSVRTREALRTLGLTDGAHRSHQLDGDDIAWADLIVGFEPQHVAYVRRNHPGAARITATLRRLLRDLPRARGLEGSRAVADRLREMELAVVELEPWEEVVDPAGGDQPDFDACAAEIARLLVAVLPQLGLEVSSLPFGWVP